MAHGRSQVPPPVSPWPDVGEMGVARWVVSLQRPCGIAGRGGDGTQAIATVAACQYTSCGCVLGSRKSPMNSCSQGATNIAGCFPAFLLERGACCNHGRLGLGVLTQALWNSGRVLSKISTWLAPLFSRSRGRSQSPFCHLLPAHPASL